MVENSEVKYKFDEGRIFEELKTYINSTYAQHYAGGKDGTQTFELVVSSDNAKGFTMGSIMKYASRYGKKNGFNRTDLMKILHYAMLALYVHDKEHSVITVANSTTTSTIQWRPITILPSLLSETTIDVKE